MSYVEELERKIRSIGWFSGTLRLNIKLESEFEGFYGKASEDWEKRVTVEVNSPDELKVPSFRAVGKRFQTIDDVCKRAIDVLNSYNDATRKARTINE